MKNKICALLLAVSVAFSGIPAANVFASPLVSETMEDVVTEEIIVENAEESIELETDVEENAVKEVETKKSASGEIEELEGITTEAKAYGSNGKAYEGVEYLSIAEVDALPVNAQEAYYGMCDSVAEMYDSGIKLDNVVITADDECVRIDYKIPVSEMWNRLPQNFAEIEEKIEDNTSVLEESLVLEETEEDNSSKELDILVMNESLFKDQLNSTEKILYNAAKKAMVTKANPTFKATFKGRVSLSSEPLDAVSALVNTYPIKLGWMAKAKNSGISGTGIYYYYYNKSVWTFKYPKSKHYSSSLEKKAKKQVDKLVDLAYEYAEYNYPDSPTYGIIKYFNDWICENNYYEYKGTERETYGNKPLYYFCHSCYGILLKGYGVCESYALAMTRLLDAAGIRNIYVVGDAGGGHAWNYVQMPDGEWYMLDSTWNDDEYSTDWDDYLLVTNDGMHTPTGKFFNGGSSFSFYSLSSTDYEDAAYESMVINKSELVIEQGDKYQLTVDSEDYPSDYFNKFKKTWRSSDTRVAKVNKNGKVTTGKVPGIAEITCYIAGRELSCTVYVYKVTKLTFDDNYKSSYVLDYYDSDSEFTEEDEQIITLSVGQKNATLSASEIAEKKFISPSAKSNKTYIARINEVSVSDDTITLKVLPRSRGTAKITVEFSGKKATLTFKVH